MELFFGVILLLVAHYVADFYCQPRDIAVEKSYSMRALITHVVLYSTSLFIVLFLGLYFMGFVSELHAIQVAVGIVVVNSFFHYTIDFFTSKINSYFWKTKQVRNFWLTIGFDQLLHTGLLVYCYAEMLENFRYI